MSGAVVEVLPPIQEVLEEESAFPTWPRSVARKYVSYYRDPSDTLAPGTKFGYWGYNAGPEPCPVSAHTQVQVDFADSNPMEGTMREPLEAWSENAPKSHPLGRADTLTEAFRRANDERRLKEVAERQISKLEREMEVEKERLRKRTEYWAEADRTSRAIIQQLRGDVDVVREGLRAELAAAREGEARLQQVRARGSYVHVLPISVSVCVLVNIMYFLSVLVIVLVVGVWVCCVWIW